MAAAGDEKMTSDHIISVNETDFEFEVVEYSKHVPVVVDFWAEWCGPCKTIGPALERLAEMAGGAFRLAKVNVDENPNLALRFNVRSIPTVKAFRDGQVVAEFTGALPEGKIREFVRSLAPSQHDLVLEKGLSLLDLGDWTGAEENLARFLEKFPGHPGALLGMARSLLAQGYLPEAQRILLEFPASKEYNTAEAMLPLVKALNRARGEHALPDEPLAAAYSNALRLALRGNFEAAMDGMLDVLRQDKRYLDGEVRKVLLGMFELLGAKSELTSQYRNELAMVLF